MLLAVGFLNNISICISGSLVRFKKYCKVPPDEASLVQLGGGGGGEKR